MTKEKINKSIKKNQLEVKRNSNTKFLLPKSEKLLKSKKSKSFKFIFYLFNYFFFVKNKNTNLCKNLNKNENENIIITNNKFENQKLNRFDNKTGNKNEHETLEGALDLYWNSKII